MTAEPDTPNDIETPTGLRATALDALAYFGGRAKSVDIAEVANIPSGSRTYHLKELVDAGLIEADGYRRTDSGQQAKVYRLTAEGDRVVEQLGGDVMSDDIDTLHDEVNRLRERVGDLETELDEFREAHNEMADIVEELWDEVRGG